MIIFINYKLKNISNRVIILKLEHKDLNMLLMNIKIPKVE